MSSLEEVATFVQADVLTLFREVLFDSLTTSVLVSGSIVDGFGNFGSDIDLYVVEPSSSVASSNRFWAGSRRWIDEVRLTYDHVETLVSALAKADRISTGWSANAPFSRRDLDVLHRLSIAVKGSTPVEPEWAQRLAVIDRSHLRRVIASQHVRVARALWMDSTGAYMSGDLRQASYAASLCLLTAVDAWLALLDETSVSEKWRWSGARRADAASSDPLHIARLAYEVHSCAEPAGAHLTMRRAAALLFACQRFLVTGRPPADLPTPDRPDARFELAAAGTVVIHADGGSTPFPKDVDTQHAEHDRADPFLRRLIV